VNNLPSPLKKPKKNANKKKIKDEEGVPESEDELELQPPPTIPEEDVGMGGPEGRVYWPPGMEEWLRPKKREAKPRDPEKVKTTADRAAARRAEKAAWQAAQEAKNEDLVSDKPVPLSSKGVASKPKMPQPAQALRRRTARRRVNYHEEDDD